MMLRYFAFLTFGLSCLLVGGGQPAAANSMTFIIRSGPGCGFAPCLWIAAEGVIARESRDRFLEVVKREELQGTALSVVVNSPGGNLLEGMRLGRAIRALGFNTIVGKMDCNTGLCKVVAGECHSACAYMFLGGVRRALHDESKFGVHQFYRRPSGSAGQTDPDEAISSAQSIQSEISAYLGEMGVSRRLLEIAGRVPPGKVEILSDEYLRILNIRTDISRPPTTWQLVPQGRGLRLVGSRTAFETGGSVQITSTISFACSQSDLMRVQVSFHQAGNPIAKLDLKQLRGWVTSGPYLAFDSRWLEVKDRFSELQKTGPETLHFSLYLSKEEFLSLQDANELRVGIGMPSSLAGGPGSKFELDGAHKSVALLLRNCEK